MSLPNCYRCGRQPCECADGITLYHADCQEILPLLESGSVDLVLTDPPYGINYSSSGRSVAATATDYSVMQGDGEPFDPAPLLRFSRVALWGANYYGNKLPSSPSWWIWDKRPGGQVNDSADCELAWTNLGGPARCFRHLWMGMLRDSERNRPSLHPTRKPLALMQWCLQQAGEDNLILDPFAGSGTTGRACKDLGRKCIMVEIEEKYCEVSARRLNQEVGHWMREPEETR